MRVDYLIVGAGLTGAVIARTLADAGREVLVLDRRSHLGGNVHDHTHPSGIIVHTYGPHHFRTSSDRIWDYVNRFCPFFTYEHCVVSDVDGELPNWPIAGSYIKRVVGDGWKPEFTGSANNMEEAALSLMPRAIYEKFVKEYNEKQWGVPVRQLSPKLCQRFDVRHDDDPRFKPTAKYQGIPELGYAELTRRMFAGIPVLLNFDYLERKAEVLARKLVIFTGPIDSYFGYELGKLQYRGQQRTHTYLPDVDWKYPAGATNNPLHSGGPHVRTIEWKHWMKREWAEKIRGTLLTSETPFSPTNPNDFEYPFPDDANARLYQEYRRRADALDGTLICGRLGEYRYYDMDQAIARAMSLADRLLHEGAAARPAHEFSEV
jgi:UDP-galactopyranose mutase